MTFALGEGGYPKADNSSDRLCDCVSDKGEEVVESPDNFADILCVWPPENSKKLFC